MHSNLPKRNRKPSKRLKVNNMKIFSENPPLWLINVASLGTCMMLALALIYFYADNRKTQINQNKAEIARALPPPQNLIENPFENIELTAKSAIVYDATRKVIIFGKNEIEQFPLASLAKLMMAVVADDTLPDFTSIEIVRQKDEPDVQLKTGERWPLSELLSYTLLTSSNTGANSIAAATAAYLRGFGTQTVGNQDNSQFARNMTQKARDIGLNQTYFLNPSGLDTGGQVSGAYGSARDVALLMAYILENKPEILDSTKYIRQKFIAPDGRTISAENTNARVFEIPGLLGSKTGLTDLAGGNLVIAFDASFNEPLIVVALSSTETGRFEDVSKLVQATIDYFGAGLKIPQSGTVEDLTYNTDQ